MSSHPKHLLTFPDEVCGPALRNTEADSLYVVVLFNGSCSVELQACSAGRHCLFVISQISRRGVVAVGDPLLSAPVLL